MSKVMSLNWLIVLGFMATETKGNIEPQGRELGGKLAWMPRRWNGNVRWGSQPFPEEVREV